MYFEDLALLLGTVQSILLAVKDDRFEQNALAVLVEFLPIELENAGLHEDLLYFQNYQPLVLPFELLPKYKIAQNLKLVLKIMASPESQHPQQLKHSQGVPGFATSLPTQAQNRVAS